MIINFLLAFTVLALSQDAACRPCDIVAKAHEIREIGYEQRAGKARRIFEDCKVSILRVLNADITEIPAPTGTLQDLGISDSPENYLWSCFEVLCYANDDSTIQSYIRSNGTSSDLLKGRLCRALAWKYLARRVHNIETAHDASSLNVLVEVAGDKNNSLGTRIEAIVAMQPYTQGDYCIDYLDGDTVKKLRFLINTTVNEFAGRSTEEQKKILAIPVQLKRIFHERDFEFIHKHTLLTSSEPSFNRDKKYRWKPEAMGFDHKWESSEWLWFVYISVAPFALVLVNTVIVIMLWPMLKQERFGTLVVFTIAGAPIAFWAMLQMRRAA